MRSRRYGHRAKIAQDALKPNNSEFEAPAGMKHSTGGTRDIYAEALDSRFAWIQEQKRIRQQHGAVRVIMRGGKLVDPVCRCGYPKSSHRPEEFAHHSECTVETFVPAAGGGGSE